MSNEFCVRVYYIEAALKSRSMWTSCQ